MQSNLEFGDRQVRLPAYTLKRNFGCGVIEQTIMREGDYRITASRNVSLTSSELDLEDCAFETVLLHENKKSKIDTALPCVVTNDAADNIIKAHSWSLKNPEEHASTADQIRCSWENALHLKREAPNDSPGFRNAQVGAIHAVLAHWSVSEQPCTVVLPTGTGKTETMIGIAVAEKAKLAVIIVPTQDLRVQLARKFKELGMLKKIGVLDKSALLPKVATLSSGLAKAEDLDVLLTCNVIVSTPAILGRDRSLFSRLAKEVTHVFFDEAHHLKAPSWEALKKGFSQSRIVQFTATPYRLDRQPIDGKVVYQYSLEHAQRDGCFSEISLITVDERNPDKKDASIARAAYERLLEDREAGYTKHCIMVRAGDRHRADILYEMYCRMFPGEKIERIYTGVLKRKEKIEALKRGEYSIIVCVDMLKEGFDFPEFKIGAVHDLHKSLGVAMQFIGRFTRDRSDLGRAHVVVNFAQAEIPLELEKLYADGSGWSEVIAEVAQSKQQEAIEFIDFLSGCQPYKSFDDPDQTISPRLVNPALSCVVYSCKFGVEWSRFHKAFPANYRFSQPYENTKSRLFYFSAQAREPVKWTRSEAIRDQIWTLVIMHYAEDQGLLYIGCSDNKFKHENLANMVCKGEHMLLHGNSVFRCFQNIKRLKIIHAGLLKPANRNHRYSKYSGADVTTQLEVLQSGGRARKSDFVGIGYKDGKPVGVGASQKGKIWNPARVGNPKEWIEWSSMTGALLIDEKIDPNRIFKDTAKVKAVEHFPDDMHVIAMDWNEETFEKYHRMALVDGSSVSTPLFLCEFAAWRLDDTKLHFEIRREGRESLAVVIELKGEDGHAVCLPKAEQVMVSGWRREDEPLEKFLLDYPPTLFLSDGSLLSGCQHTEFHATANSLPEDFFEPWTWEGIDIETEAAYKSKDGQIIFRADSIQQRVMEKCKDDGAALVFNDDGSGESADVVAIFDLDKVLIIKLIHCKFSKGATPGHRVGDLYEICGQAVKSVKWKWDAKSLFKHLQNRKNQGLGIERRFFQGNADVISGLNRKIDYTDVRFEFWIVQPGLDSQGISEDIKSLLMSSAATIADMTECRLRCISS